MLQDEPVGLEELLQAITAPRCFWRLDESGMVLSAYSQDIQADVVALSERLPDPEQPSDAKTGPLLFGTAGALGSRRQVGSWGCTRIALFGGCRMESAHSLACRLQRRAWALVLPAANSLKSLLKGLSWRHAFSYSLSQDLTAA